MLQHGWLFITGCLMFGYLLPEVLVAAFKVRVPLVMNIVSAIASACIAASFVN